jgi:ACS family pantothenate transporter-like MFS transporter
MQSDEGHVVMHKVEVLLPDRDVFLTTNTMTKATDQEVQVHHTAVDVVQEQPKRRWQSYVWDYLDKSPEERRFLFKLDSAVLTFAYLGYFIKALDQNNIKNAFVSGM